MAETRKLLSDYDAAQITQKIYNKEGGTIGVDGFIAGQVGRKIVKTNTSATVETFEFFENQTTLLFTIQITYTDATKEDISEVERTV